MPKTYSVKGIQLRTNYLNLPKNSNLKERARALRKARNLPEVLFWMQVNKFQFHGLDFDRQKIIGNYIVDFYCKALGLVVEIDGITHEGRENQDSQRQKWLEQQGCRVIRFTSTAIRFNMSQVLMELEEYIVTNYS